MWTSLRGLEKAPQLPAPALLIVGKVAAQAIAARMRDEDLIAVDG